MPAVDARNSSLRRASEWCAMNNEFVAWCRSGPIWPFETLVPRRHFARWTSSSWRAVATGLAEILRALTIRYDNLFDVSFPYSMGLHQSPDRRRPIRSGICHAHFYPPLLRSATVRKFMVGYEMLGRRNATSRRKRPRSGCARWPRRTTWTGCRSRFRCYVVRRWLPWPAHFRLGGAAEGGACPVVNPGGAKLPSRDDDPRMSGSMATPRGEEQRMQARIVTVHVPVSDVDRAKRFYTDAIGCRVVSDQQEQAGQASRRVVRLQAERRRDRVSAGQLASDHARRLPARNDVHGGGYRHGVHPGCGRRACG